MRRFLLWLAILIPFIVGYLVAVSVRLWRFLVAAFAEGYRVGMV